MSPADHALTLKPFRGHLILLRGRRLPSPGSSPGARPAGVRDAQGNTVRRPGRTRTAVRWIRRVRERIRAQRPERAHAPGHLRCGPSRFAPAARLGGRRPGDGTADGNRWLHRERVRMSGRWRSGPPFPQDYEPADPERSTHLRSRIIRSISSVLQMSTSGPAFSTTRSATLPASRVRRSLPRPPRHLSRARGGCRNDGAGRGQTHLDVHTISWCMHRPDGTFGVPASFPSATATPASRIVLTKSNSSRNAALRSSNPGSTASALCAGSFHPASASGL